MSIPKQWRSQFTPRDPLTEPRPNMPPPTQPTSARVEQERGARDRALAQAAADLTRRAKP